MPLQVLVGAALRRMRVVASPAGHARTDKTHARATHTQTTRARRHRHRHTRWTHACPALTSRVPLPGVCQQNAARPHQLCNRWRSRSVAAPPDLLLHTRYCDVKICDALPARELRACCAGPGVYIGCAAASTKSAAARHDPESEASSSSDPDVYGLMDRDAGEVSYDDITRLASLGNTMASLGVNEDIDEAE
eukprot:2512403-Rhodomonas_salina.3